MHKFYLKQKSFCKGCKRGDVPHKAFGLCRTCYMKKYRVKVVDKKIKTQ